MIIGFVFLSVDFVILSLDFALLVLGSVLLCLQINIFIVFVRLQYFWFCSLVLTIFILAFQQLPPNMVSTVATIRGARTLRTLHLLNEDVQKF